MAEIDYQKITSAPIEQIIDLYKAGGWWRESAAARNSIPALIRGSFCFMVARAAGGCIVGMGRALSDGVSDAYLQDVVVLEDYRRHGIGRELVVRLTDYCLGQGIEWIGLVAEPGTQAFYEAIGFRLLDGHLPMLYGKRG